MFTQEDRQQFSQRGLTEAQITSQIERITRGSAPLHIKQAAIENRGILCLKKPQITQTASKWVEEKQNWSPEKFVPASGAASRMFKFLFQYLNDGQSNQEIELFFSQLKDFPFYQEIEAFIQKKQWQDFSKSDQRKALISHLLGQQGLNWAECPKGLLPFHSAEENCLTPMGEHLREGRLYADRPDGTVPVHFTISDGAEQDFRKTADMETGRLQDSRFQISYSFQDPSTDTIALDEKGAPFRLTSGELLFRPGGHGSLIKNLNERPGDIFFIKNIDNVQKEGMNRWTVESFKSLAGLLLQTREALKELEHQLNSGLISDKDNFIRTLAEISGHDYSGIADAISSRKEEILKLLNSPIRICGMVKNEGEPGGGPFWVEQSNGVSNLQIVESAQIDLENPKSKEIFDSSTHFNPVFLVCLKKDLQGNALDLTEYVDQETYFIAEKSLEGRKLKALEHPGLWNGAMAKWVTRFVEIPPECFTPVKTVNDLLRDAHR